MLHRVIVLFILILVKNITGAESGTPQVQRMKETQEYTLAQRAMCARCLCGAFCCTVGSCCCTTTAALMLGATVTARCCGVAVCSGASGCGTCFCGAKIYQAACERGTTLYFDGLKDHQELTGRQARCSTLKWLSCVDRFVRRW